MNSIRLSGCHPEPLLSYLKALGVFRLVAEQVDPDARAAWKDDAFMLYTSVDVDELIRFFNLQYEPTPIVVPWSGDDFFVAKGAKAEKNAKKTPAGASVIAAFLDATTPRLQNYRLTINEINTTMERLGLVRVKATTDKDGKSKAAQLQIPGKTLTSQQCKNLLTANLRAWLPDEVIRWLDVAMALDASGDKAIFNPLLGSGGGSDGNTHFSDNFMQNLWDVLPEFDSQRKYPNQIDSTALLRGSLFGSATTGLLSGRTSSLFDSGAVGGPNATQGMNREALTNPWNFILGMEGALCLAGAASRRMNANRSAGAFPFAVRSRSVGSNTFSADKESGQWEIWVPLWSHAITLTELTLLFAEGRAEVKRKPARDGVDFSRAIASLGVDRGIQAFVRYAIVKGRIGGENYNTAAALGQFAVTPRPGADLLNEIDRWLDRARRACDNDKAPARYPSAMRRLDSAIMEYCRYGGNVRFADVLGALGAMERELGHTGKKPGQIGNDQNNVEPVPQLSWRWLQTADDGSVEFRLAVALASIQRASDKLGPLRVHLEPISANQNKWEEGSKTVVWSAGDIAHNLAAVLERRMMEAERANVEYLPLDAKRRVTPADVIAFLAGAVDEQRLEDLLWGALLIDWEKVKPYQPTVDADSFLALPRIYALLKSLFLQGDEALPTASGEPLWPDATILAALRASHVNRAAELATRRLRAAGYTPLVSDEEWSSAVQPVRLAAALLIPLALPSTPAGPRGSLTLARLLFRNPSISDQ
jgi:CRISPR-associated protein Csx17